MRQRSRLEVRVTMEISQALMADEECPSQKKAGEGLQEALVLSLEG